MKHKLLLLFICLIIAFATIIPADARIARADLETQPLGLITSYNHPFPAFPTSLASNKDIYFVIYATAATSDFYVLARPEIDPVDLARTLETAIKGTVLEKETVMYMSGHGYSWADVYADHSQFLSRSVHTRQPVGDVIQGLKSAGYKPHIILVLYRAATKSHMLHLRGPFNRKWGFLYIDPARTDIDFVLSSHISSREYNSALLLLLGPIVFYLIAIPLLILITNSKKSTPAGRRIFFFCWNICLMIICSGFVITAYSRINHSTVRYRILDMWFGQDVFLSVLPILSPLFLNLIGSIVARLIYRGGEKETRISPIDIGTRIRIVVVFIVPFILVYWIRSLLPPETLFSQLHLCIVLLLFGFLPYIYVRTTRNLPVMFGKRTTDDGLLEYLSGVAFKLDVALIQVYLVDVNPNNRNGLEAVYKRDGILLIRRNILEPVSMEQSNSILDTDISCAESSQYSGYSQDEIEFICAVEMAASKTYTRVKSLLALYLSLLIVVVPGLMFLSQSTSWLPFDWRLGLFIAGIIFMIIDSRWLERNRERDVDRLAYSVTQNLAAACRTFAQPWRRWIVIGRGNARGIPAFGQGLRRTKYIEELDRQINGESEKTKTETELSSAITARTQTLAAKIGVKECSTEVVELPYYMSAVNALVLRNNHIIVGKTLVENFTSQETDFVLAHELAHIKCNHYRYRVLLLVALLLIVMGLLLSALIHDMVFLSYMFWGTMLVLAFMVCNVTWMSKKRELQADKIALSVTGNLDAAISVIRKLTKNNPYKVSEAMEDYSTHPNESKRIQALRDEAEKLGLHDDWCI